MRRLFYSTRPSILLLVLFNLVFISTKATNYPFSATYSGANEVPANASTATGTIVGVYNDVTNTIFYTITFTALSGGAATAAHFHGPAAVGVAAGVQIAHDGFPADTFGTYSNSHVLTDAQETDLKAGLWYSNIHNATYPNGEIRAQIVLGAASTSIFSFTRTYSGENENPPNNSTATGTITGMYDSTTNTIFYTIRFSGLSAPTTGAHFHSPAAPGSNGPVVYPHGIPNGVTSDTLSNSHVITAAQETALLGGLWYSNIHSSNFPGGEIRAQIFFDAPFIAPVVTCPPDTTVGNDLDRCDASVAFQATATGDPTPTITYRVAGTLVTSPYVFPLGTTTVNVMALNGGGFDTCSFTVTVNDTQPPRISDLSASPNKLWPPNHKLRNVNVTYTATDNCPGPVTCSLSVASNEPIIGPGLGAGNTTPDWIVIDDHHVKLRAERRGNGSGRVYTITVNCTDQYNNTGHSTTTVTVPHDMHPAALTQLMAQNGIDMAWRDAIVKALSNPAKGYFTFTIEASPEEKYDIILSDMMGRTVEVKNNIMGSQTISMGQELSAGIYTATFRFETGIKVLKLVKL